MLLKTKNTFILLFILTALFTLNTGDANAQDNTAYKIYNLRTQKSTDLKTIVDDFAKADVILFGEEHNDSIAHLAEADFLKLAHLQLKDKLSLSLEMFESDVQLILNEYLSGLIKEKNLIKDARVWNNYEDYKPLLDFALAQKISVIAANAPSRYTNLVSRKGLASLNSLSNEAKRFIAPLPIDTLAGKYHENFISLMGGNHMGGMQIYQAQNVWDATMAHFINEEVKKGKKVLHINGRFHSDEKLGIAAQLLNIEKKSGRKIKTLNISCFSSEDYENPNLEKYTYLGDYLILTPPASK